MDDMDPKRVPRKRDMNQINRSKSFNLNPPRICDTKNKPQTIFRDGSPQPCQRHQDRQVYLNERSLIRQQKAQTYPNLSDECNRYDIGGRSEVINLMRGHYNSTVIHKLHQPKFSTLYEELTTNYSKYKHLDDQKRGRKISKRQLTTGPSSIPHKLSTTEGGTSSRVVRFPLSDQQLEALEHEYSKY
ncbi:hypothetical protein RF11_09427 [Thelohanellus kitauei]|uniref:Uncharacterized protein n=1 Tax=Thelohanellus kitauei TaxID=669202 RepID=A0A0C2NHD3_THEKT|nr:hypothetical protein RF11_09380 [Thelohanellus kitauei]KII73437.1 hypothetical protein RF11_09427 [Thelohanellus kitauei]